MIARREFLFYWSWLAKRFRDFDLAYLDPKICDPTLRRSRLGRAALWRSKEERDLTNLSNRISDSLGVRRGKDTPSSFLEKDGLGFRLQNDRTMQRRVACIMNDSLPALKTRHFTSVASLQKDKSALDKIADKTHASSLIFVDSMFTRKITAPEAIQRRVDLPLQESDAPRTRGIEGILSDGPASLMTLRDPAIGLKVDSAALYDCADSALMKADWYPFVRTVGLYATSPNGPTFVDVLAILIRPYPSLDEILAPPAKGESWWSLPGVLEYVQRNALEQEIDGLNKAATAPSEIYEKDGLFLYPVCFFTLCCQLNGVDWSALQSGAKQVSQVFEAYLAKIEALKNRLRTLGIESRIILQETAPEKLLPMLPEHRALVGVPLP